jgi:hypothetical protein
LRRVAESNQKSRIGVFGGPETDVIDLTSLPRIAVRTTKEERDEPQRATIVSRAPGEIDTVHALALWIARAFAIDPEPDRVSGLAGSG